MQKIGICFSFSEWPCWKILGSLNANVAKALHEDVLETILHCRVYFHFQSKTMAQNLFWLMSRLPLTLQKKWKYSFTWFALVKPFFSLHTFLDALEGNFES